MRTRIEVDATLLAEAQELCGHTNTSQTVEEALRLIVKLRRQQEVDAPLANTPGAATSPRVARARDRASQ